MTRANRGCFACSAWAVAVGDDRGMEGRERR